MTPAEGKYNIKAVSKMLGIQPGTLRAWERRYNFMSPVRNVSGHRLYTEQQVQKLKWLLDKINQGFTISQAIELLENHKTETFIEENNQQDRAYELSQHLVHALLRFDEQEAHQLLSQAFTLYSIEKVTIDILGSLLVQVGDMWEKGQITTAHEHFTSAFLRSRIGMIFHTLPVNSYLPTAVAVCCPDESHELGLLIFTLYLRRRGFKVVYLGTGIPEEDVEMVIEELKPAFLFLSCSLTENLQGALKFIEGLQKRKDLAVGIGGPACDQLSDQQYQKIQSYLVGSTKEKWDNWIDYHLSNDV
ncbi:MerR family transcriptional regulator [Bacillus taeanensis]|uniref:MerR family transcriptional regulator n=1 Tax=Bacillus taeanensis TaxID=273032 RepID=A0A366XYU6_9BACI|nr:MerR family transcriptional regulator [Bacillus taeanensis]RBW70315.1 MerR family transcriptional regulator [Bacillus taeanensis]